MNNTYNSVVKSASVELIVWSNPKNNRKRLNLPLQHSRKMWFFCIVLEGAICCPTYKRPTYMNMSYSTSLYKNLHELTTISVILFCRLEVYRYWYRYRYRYRHRYRYIYIYRDTHVCIYLSPTWHLNWQYFIPRWSKVERGDRNGGSNLNLKIQQRCDVMFLLSKLLSKLIQPKSKLISKWSCRSDRVSCFQQPWQSVKNAMLR